MIGARTDEQLADNLKAAELQLTGEQRARLEEVSRPPLLYPYWHQRKTASDRLSPADLSLIGPHLDMSLQSRAAQRGRGGPGGVDDVAPGRLQLGRRARAASSSA